MRLVLLHENEGPPQGAKISPREGNQCLRFRKKERNALAMQIPHSWREKR